MQALPLPPILGDPSHALQGRHGRVEQGPASTADQRRNTPRSAPAASCAAHAQPPAPGAPSPAAHPPASPAAASTGPDDPSGQAAARADGHRSVLQPAVLPHPPGGPEPGLLSSSRHRPVSAAAGPVAGGLTLQEAPSAAAGRLREAQQVEREAAPAAAQAASGARLTAGPDAAEAQGQRDDREPSRGLGMGDAGGAARLEEAAGTCPCTCS